MSQKTRVVFADTFCFLALLSEVDEAHARATEFAAEFEGRIVTTDWVLTELADGLASRAVRTRCAKAIRAIVARRDVTVVPAGRRHFNAGFELYARRLDKDWSLTDCISFVVMRARRLRAALTGDHHFEQAGFVALLK